MLGDIKEGDMKRQRYGGYPIWRCRKCSILFMDTKWMSALNLPDRNCTSNLALYDGEHWHYSMTYKGHPCKDGGVGLADFIGLSPTKV